MATEVQRDTRTIAMEAQAHINRHEDICTKRWQEARDAAIALAKRVDELAAILNMARVFVLKSAFWLISILVTTVVGLVGFILLHKWV